MEENAEIRGDPNVTSEGKKLFSVSLNAKPFLKSENSVCSIQAETRYQNIDSARA